MCPWPCVEGHKTKYVMQCGSFVSSVIVGLPIPLLLETQVMSFSEFAIPTSQLSLRKHKDFLLLSGFCSSFYGNEATNLGMEATVSRVCLKVDSA